MKKAVDNGVDLIAYTMSNHGRIIFNGNNYSNDWQEEANRRGLSIMRSTVDAAEALNAEKNIALFEKYHILNRTECHSRYEICLENYIKTIHIEADTMIQMASRQILPAAIKYAGMVADSVNSLSRAKIRCDSAKKKAKKLAECIDNISACLEELNEKLGALGTEFSRDKAEFCCDEIIPSMDNLRAACDEIEPMIDNSLWPMPNYTEILHRI